MLGGNQKLSFSGLYFSTILEYEPYCCRKWDSFQGLKQGSCLTLGNELSKETYVLTKQEILLGKGTRVESRRVREPRRTALSHGLQFGFYGDGISFRVVFSQSFWLRVLPEWCTPCSVKMDDSEKDSERWLDMWCLLLTFPELFQLVGLISSVFLSRTSCCKTTYANGYNGAWPGWAVWVSVLPLTIWLLESCLMPLCFLLWHLTQSAQ